MSTELVQRSVSFYGDELAVIRQCETDYTPVKPICDALGIDWEAQRQRITRDEVLSIGACVLQAPSAGGPQQMLCLPLDFLNGWLFGVSAGHIRPENRENLKRYKLECYRVLSRAFQGQGDQLAELRAEVRDLRGEVAELQHELRGRRKAARARKALPAPRSREEQITAVLARIGRPMTARELAQYIRGLSSAEAREQLEGLVSAGAVAVEPSRKTSRFRPLGCVDVQTV